jgi:8-oxoguanine deaminase
MSRLWVKNPLHSFDGTQAGTVAGGVVVEDGWIVETLAHGQQPSTPAENTFDASGLVLMPGLINTHHHFYQTLTRAHIAALDKPLFAWLQSLYPVWAGLTEEMIEVATELAICELLHSGCTTTVDHHYVFSDPLREAIDRQVAVADRLGMRVVLTRGSMSLGVTDGGLPPDSVVQDHDTILTDSERLISRYHQAVRGSMCQIALAPCSPFSVTAELMRDTAELARQHDVLLHTHLAETSDETEFCIDQFGRRPLDYLTDLGWLESRTWFAHGIHFNEEEIRRIGKAGSGIAHCPTSNMLLASGICPAEALEHAGANIGLGVDGSASNDCSNLFQEVRQSLLIQRLRGAISPATNHPDPSSAPPLTSHIDVLRWATSGGANLLHRAELGRLQVGAAADLALFAVDETRFSGSQDPLAALVLSGAHRAQAVMVNGQWRVLNGEPVNIDLDALIHRHSQAAHQLWAAG